MPPVSGVHTSPKGPRAPPIPYGQVRLYHGTQELRVAPAPRRPSVPWPSDDPPAAGLVEWAIRAAGRGAAGCPGCSIRMAKGMGGVGWEVPRSSAGPLHGIPVGRVTPTLQEPRAPGNPPSETLPCHNFPQPQPEPIFFIFSVRVLVQKWKTPPFSDPVSPSRRPAGDVFHAALPLADFVRLSNRHPAPEDREIRGEPTLREARPGAGVVVGGGVACGI